MLKYNTIKKDDYWIALLQHYKFDTYIDQIDIKL